MEHSFHSKMCSTSPCSLLHDCFMTTHFSWILWKRCVNVAHHSLCRPESFMSSCYLLLSRHNKNNSAEDTVLLSQPQPVYIVIYVCVSLLHSPSPQSQWAGKSGSVPAVYLGNWAQHCGNMAGKVFTAQEEQSRQHCSMCFTRTRCGSYYLPSRKHSPHFVGQYLKYW